MIEEKSISPVKDRLQQSRDLRRRSLCNLSDKELLDYVNLLVSAEKDSADGVALFFDAQELLEERDPVRYPYEQALNRASERLRWKEEEQGRESTPRKNKTGFQIFGTAVD